MKQDQTDSSVTKIVQQIVKDRTYREAMVKKGVIIDRADEDFYNPTSISHEELLEMSKEIDT
jgi:hypothetical protein